jgi:hypothetical protein
MSPSPVYEVVEPFIVGRPQERRCTIPKFHRMVSTCVGVECLQVCESLDELKVVRSRGLAEQGEHLDPGIV